MAARLRVFVALTFPDAEAARLDELRRFFGARSLGRVPPHVTLVPPLERSPSEVWALLGRVARAAHTTAPFSLATQGFGYFVNRRVSGVLPVVEGGTELEALRQALDVGRERRAFVPHVTVGDGIEEETARAAQRFAAHYRFESARPELSLLVADLRDPRRRWVPLASALLGHGGPRRRSHLEVELLVARGAPESALDGSRPLAVWALDRDGAPMGWCELRPRVGTSAIGATVLGPLVLLDDALAGFGLEELLLGEALRHAQTPVVVSGGGPWDEWAPVELSPATATVLGLPQGITWKALNLSTR